MTVTDYNFIQKLQKLPFIERIWLYGSRARGDFKDRSDIDIAIECPHATDSDWYKVEDIIEDADTLLKIDCVRWDEIKEGSLFQQHIFKDRKLIFQRTGFLEEKKQIFQRISNEAIKPRWEENFEDLGRALERLKEALNTPLDANRLNMDGTIHRFEFCIELFWKNLKHFVERGKIKVISPRDVVSQAYQMEWVDNEKLWLDMLQDHNVLSHNYNEHIAEDVYARIKAYYPEMKDVYERLKNMSHIRYA